MLRVPYGADLYEHLSAFCRARRIRLGTIAAIGAFTEVTVGYYDQKERRYYKKRLRGDIEIVSCLGNVSVKDGQPFLHLHAALGDKRLRMLGGHLFPGSSVFAAEARIDELAGGRRVRVPDARTGLALWDCGAT